MILFNKKTCIVQISNCRCAALIALSELWVTLIFLQWLPIHAAAFTIPTWLSNAVFSKDNCTNVLQRAEVNIPSSTTSSSHRRTNSRLFTSKRYLLCIRKTTAFLKVCEIPWLCLQTRRLPSYCYERRLDLRGFGWTVVYCYEVMK